MIRSDFLRALFAPLLALLGLRLADPDDLVAVIVTESAPFDFEFATEATNPRWKPVRLATIDVTDPSVDEWFALIERQGQRNNALRPLLDNAVAFHGWSA